MRRLSRPQEAEALIIGLIRREELLPGRRLPSEEALSEMAGASRSTIRSALLKLERQGLVVRRHGIGTFATGAMVNMAMSLEVLTSIAGVIRSNGFEPRTERNIVRTEWEPPASVRERLRVPEGSPVHYIERLYLADAFPAIYVVNRIPLYLDGVLVDMTGFQGEVLPFFESRVGLPVERAVTDVRAVNADRELAAAMSVKVGTALLLLEQVAYSRQQPVAHSLAYHNSQYITYNATRLPVAYAGAGPRAESSSWDGLK